MSTVAPWLAISTDWQDSAMFDDSTHGERLAWICLLCHTKSQGRGGKVRFRKNAFQTAYRLSERSVDGMIERARKCAAISFDGEVITLCNWKVYQQKAWSAMRGNDCEKPETTVNTATHHQAPSTNHPAQITPNLSGASPPTSRSSVRWSEADGWTGITEKHRQTWRAAYPACNIDRQLAAMTAWLVANPEKAVKRAWLRFITNWLSKGQERGGDIQSNRPMFNGQPTTNGQSAIDREIARLEAEEAEQNA